MINFKPQKGKAYDRLPLKTLSIFDNKLYLVSTKYDGNQIFINKVGDKVRWFTSDWKEFNLPKIGKKLSELSEDFTLMAEMNYNSDGKLGARTKVQGRITTERVNFAKGLPCVLDESKVQIMVFDILMEDISANQRLTSITNITYKAPFQVMAIRPILMTGKEAIDYTKELVSKGWEGTMLADPEETYHIGKRVNHMIKLKYRPTADLLCVDVEPGEGKYTDMIGALVLEDMMGRVVKVGSGLSDEQRGWHEDNFIDKIIEIEYEQIMDTYQQPTFVCVREDKYVSD